MRTNSIDIKDEVFNFFDDISPLDKDLMLLFSGGLSSEEIAERSFYPEDFADDRRRKILDKLRMVNFTYIDDLSSIDTKQIQQFETFEMSDLGVVAERVLSSEKTYVSASDICDSVNENYDRNLDSNRSGRNLRILGEEILDEEEYKKEYLQGGNTKKWNVSHLRENYTCDILNLINDNVSRNEFKFNLDERQEVDTKNQKVIDAYTEDISGQIDEYSTEAVLKYIKKENPDIEKLNRQLMDNSEKTVLQVSRVTENADGWAPDALKSFEVDVDNEEVYGKTALLSRRGCGPNDTYKVEKIID